MQKEKPPAEAGGFSLYILLQGRRKAQLELAPPQVA